MGEPALQGAAPRASILIPTRDGLGDLVRLLPLLRDQVVTGGYEVRVLDSSSTDGTVERLQEEAQWEGWKTGGRCGFFVDSLAVEDFSHGASRNRLAAGARGEHVVFLSQDALPEGDGFVEQLLGPLSDSRVAGVTARVLPHLDADPLTERTVLSAAEAGTERRLYRLPSGCQMDELRPSERRDLQRFNNVASALRASILADHPFPSVGFGEDSAWAGIVLQRGWDTIFEPQAVVRHSHTYGPLTAFRRYRTDAAFQREAYGYLLRPSLWSALRGWVYEVSADLGFIMRTGCAPWALLRSPALRLGQVAGQWAGSRGGLSS